MDRSATAPTRPRQGERVSLHLRAGEKRKGWWDGVWVAHYDGLARGGKEAQRRAKQNKKRRHTRPEQNTYSGDLVGKPWARGKTLAKQVVS